MRECTGILHVRKPFLPLFSFQLLFPLPFFGGNATVWGGGGRNVPLQDGRHPSSRFPPFLLPSADTKRTISKSAQICFQGNFPPNVINCSSFCKNRRHRLNSDFLKGRKRMPRTSVSSSFTFPFLNAEFSLVCGIPFFFLFLFSKNKKADEERRREKTKNEKEKRLRNIACNAFSLPWTGVFSFPSPRKKGKEKGTHRPSFFSSVVKEKKKTPLA